MHPRNIVFVIAVCVSAIASSSGQPFQCSGVGRFVSECSAQVQGTPLQRLFTEKSYTFLNLSSLLSNLSTTFCQPPIKDALFNFLGCLTKKFVTCLPSDWRRLIPSLDRIKQAFDYMCDNINDVDAPCLESPDRKQIAADCIRSGFQRSFNFSTSDEYLTFFCSLSPLMETCVEKAYGSCPKRTAEVLIEVSKYNRPEGCDACVSQPSLLLLLVSVLTFMLASFK